MLTGKWESGQFSIKLHNLFSYYLHLKEQTIDQTVHLVLMLTINLSNSNNSGLKWGFCRLFRPITCLQGFISVLWCPLRFFFYFQRRTLFNLKDTKKNYIKFCDPAVFTGYHGGYGPDNKMTKIKNTNIHTMIDSTLHRKLKIEGWTHVLRKDI